MKTGIKNSILQAFQREFMNNATTDKRKEEIVESLKQLGLKKEWKIYKKYLINMKIIKNDDWNIIKELQSQ